MGRHKQGGSSYTAGWYDYDLQQVCLKSWHKGRVQVRKVDFPWYFYLPDDEVDEIMCPAFEDMIDGVKREGNGWTRVYMDVDYDERRSVASWLRRRRIEPRELDVSPVHRYLTDNRVELDPNPRVLFFDFETDAREGFGCIPTHRVLSASHGGVGRKTECMVAYTDDDKGERELLSHLLKVVGDNDVLVAWNGSKYDELVFKGRCKTLRLFPKWRMVNYLDMMALFQHSYYGYGRDAEGRGVKVSWALGNISKTVLGWGKMDIKEEAESLLGRKWTGFAQMIVDVFREARELLVKYNLRDVDVMVALEEDREYISALIVLSRLCNRFVSDYSLYIGYLNDGFILRWGHENGVHFPTKESMFDLDKFDKDDRHGEKYEGAFVVEPKPGMYENVTPVDFGALYPNIIDSFNISPETRVRTDARIGDKARKPRNTSVTVTGAQFDMDRDGVFPQIVRMAKEQRAPHKAKAERLEKEGKEDTREFKMARHYAQGWKLVGVGSYGVMGAPSSRYYDRECARAVTLTGQFIIKNMVLKVAHREGIEPLAGDTDGGFLWCDYDKAFALSKVSAKETDEYVVECGGKPGLIRLDLSPMYERIVFLVKKRYFGIKTTGKLDIKGIELVRSDRCRYTREMQRRFIEYVLEGRRPDADVAERIVTIWRDRLFSGEVPVEDLVLAQSMSMPLSAYKASVVHTRVAAKMIEDGKEVYIGSKIQYILTGKKDGRLEAVHADDFDGEYNAAIYWGRAWPASRRILKTVFPEGYWGSFDKYDPRQVTLFGERKARCRGRKKAKRK